MPDPQGRYQVDKNGVALAEGRPMLIQQRSGLNVVVWRKRGAVYSMVSNVAGREMIRMLGVGIGSHGKIKPHKIDSSAPMAYPVAY